MFCQQTSMYFPWNFVETSPQSQITGLEALIHTRLLRVEDRLRGFLGSGF